MNETLELVFKWLQILAILGGLIGAGAIFSHRVNHNFDQRFQNEKTEREKAAHDADEREQARIEEMIILHEEIVSVGYVARETADAHLAKCGPNEKISTALQNYADCRKKEEAQLRRNSSRYTQRQQLQERGVS